MQAAHAAHEAGAAWGVPPHCHLVVLAVTDEAALEKAAERLERHGIRFRLFWEPDDAMGHTALCTEPIVGNQRRALRPYPLWNPMG